MADKTKALLAREPEIVAALRHCPVVECAHCAFAGEECKLGEQAATLIEAMAAELFAGPGAVRKTLHKYVSAR